MKTPIFTTLLIILVLSGCIETQDIPQTEISEEFLENYVIAINSLHMSYNYSNLAQVNYNLFIFCAADEGCPNTEFYADYDLAIEYIGESKNFLSRAKSKFQTIIDSAPNDFYKEEIELRLKQITWMETANMNLKKATEAYYNYQLEGGIESDYKKHIENLEKYNKAAKNFIEVGNQIDTKWDQDWYPNTFIK